MTQAQWQAVAQFPKITIDLEADTGNFKGNDRPVELINWYEAIEFCDRLSAKTGKIYTLPSEAQWEYACRAGTQTPFAFGEILTPELANYDWTKSYNGSPKRSSYPKTTQPVGSYPANVWGLYDMHGNVWEWCLDHWHETYQDAPTDGSAWINNNYSSTAFRLMRGASFNYGTRYCRSACRYDIDPDDRYNYIGFRVVCSGARTSG